MKRRLFIAILLEEEIKRKIEKIKKEKMKKFPSSSLRWVEKENFHITLNFLGNVEEEKIEEIKKAILKAVKEVSSFPIILNEVLTFPEKKPRMIWVSGEVSPFLLSLKKKIDDNLREINISFKDNHPFRLHITLARAKGRVLFKREFKEKIQISFLAKEIGLMESKLSPKGPTYIPLSIFSLKKL